MSQPGRKSATLRDVAAAAGVSVWTASNAFSHRDRVAEDTRQRVLAAADALDYAGPNPRARTLALGQTGLIALVSPQESSPLLHDSGAALVAQGLLGECDCAWRSLVLTGSGGELAVDGQVFLRWFPATKVRTPAVVVDGAGGELPAVRADAEGAAAQLAQLLVGMAHRHIAVISGPGHDSRREAALGVLAGAGEISIVNTTGTPWATHAHGESAARKVLAARPRPTALLCMSDQLALGALDGARQVGLAVPRDVSVTGLGDLPGAAEHGLTTALIPYRPMGELAGRILIEQMAGNPAGAVPLLPAPLTIRSTTATAPEPQRDAWAR